MNKKEFILLHKVYSGAFLLIAVFLVASLSTAYMTFAFLVGTPLAIAGSNYWFEVWIGFDKLCNAALGGDHKETISSRLGKSTEYGLPPVFLHIVIDNAIAWMLDQVDPNHCKDSIDWRYGDRFPARP